MAAEDSIDHAVVESPKNSPDVTNHRVSEGPRENMIATAVKFLQNPKVRESPFDQRRKFLEKKGLTKEEIDIAIERSGTAADMQHSSQPPSPGQLVPVAAPGQPVVQQAPVSTWAKFRDHLSTAILVGGVSYALYVVFKRYIAPVWLGPSKEQQQLIELNRSVSELQQNIRETLQSIQEMQGTFNKQQGIVEDIARNSAASRGPSEYLKMQDTQHVNEIKDEIKSLKGLLLNRKQFPPAPVTQPLIPAWQLVSTPASSSTETVVTATETTATLTTTTTSTPCANTQITESQVLETSLEAKEETSETSTPVENGETAHSEETEGCPAVETIQAKISDQKTSIEDGQQPYEEQTLSSDIQMDGALNGQCDGVVR